MVRPGAPKGEEMMAMDGIMRLEETAATETAPHATDRRTMLGGAVGHFAEWFDWAIYGYLAGVFADQMFPASDARVSLIASFAVFAIGFVARPLGAFILSPLADKYGRRNLLSATILMTGAGSLLIACCPTYRQIGFFAPVLIMGARLLQGFSAGGEYQIAVTFMNEHADAKHRAFSASPQTVATGVAVLAATGVASLVTGLVPAAAIPVWGWRLAFGLGGVLSLIGVYVRLGIAESPSFEKVRPRATVTVASILASIAEFPREVAVVFVLEMSTLMFYLWIIYLPTYATLVGGLDRTAGLLGSVLSNVFFCLAVPPFAALSDRIGRKPLLYVAALGFFFFTYPLLHLLSRPHLSFARFLGVALVGTLFVAMQNAVLGTVCAELFPTRVRATAFGLPYAVCATLFGGTAPMIATWLQGVGGPLFIAAYVMVICAITLATHLFFTPETYRQTLDR
jgi:MHS family alpha-ketoglutarate permease-like MFS transporter